MTKPSKSQSATSELAKALSMLNGPVKPVRHGNAEPANAELRISQLRVSRSLAVSHSGGLLVCIELSEGQTSSLIKLFDLSRKLPFIASLGPHTPGSISGNGRYHFAHATGLEIRSGMQLGLEIVFVDNTVVRTRVQVQPLQDSTCKFLLELCSFGADSFRELIRQEPNRTSTLHQIAARLLQYEKKNASRFTGKVDSIVGGVIEGWFWNTAEPKMRYEIQAWKGDRLVGYTLANIWREDLEKAGKDDGKLKFELKVANSLNDGNQHVLNIKVCEPDSGELIVELGGPVNYQHLNRSFSMRVAPDVMDTSTSIRLLDALLKKARLGERSNITRTCFMKVFMHLECMDYRPARQLIEQQMQLGFDNGFARAKLAETYLIEQNYAKAADLYRMVISKAKDFVWSHIGLGFALEKLGQRAEAIHAYQEVLKISPRFTQISDRISQLESELQADSAESLLSPDLILTLIRHTQRALLVSPHDLELGDKILELERQLYRINGKIEQTAEHAAPRSLALRRLQQARLYLQAQLHYAR